MKRIFIDGSAGTTGLRLRQRIEGRKDLQLIELEEKYRKDIEHRKQAMEQADAVVLCLPDDAAREAVGFAAPDKLVLDTSTAHRTLPGWTYGLPQLGEQQKAAVQTAKRIAVPGCHACGFITLVQPLVQAGILDKAQPLHCFSLTGYSGGGKNMIAQYEGEEKSPLLKAPRLYGLSQQHKHLKEMKAITGIDQFPVFAPIVGDFYSGMEVMVPLAIDQIGADGIDKIKEVYRNRYNGKVIRFEEDCSEDGFLSAAAFSGKDCMQISVQGNAERVVLVARYDNLGKGASGAAVECLNLALGLEQTAGLEL